MDDLTDQQKSVLLAKAMGWDTENMTDTVVMIDTPEGKPFFSFYNPANMALAWRVLNWARKTKPNAIGAFWFQANMPNLPPAHAQRLWLDKIFELCVEAGIVELKKE